MKEVILDTSFILTCVKQKIDFFEELKFMGMKVLIPRQVIRELENMKTNDNAQLSLQILDKNNFEEIDLIGKDVDKGLIAYAGNHSDIFVATLDREIKDKIRNSKVVVREKKRLEVI